MVVYARRIFKAACNRGDRTDGTDGSPTSHEETLAYYCELWHHAAVPGLRPGVATRPRGPGYRVEDIPGSTRRTGSSRRRSGSATATGRTTLRHYVRLTTAARAKAVADLDEVTRAALERAEQKVLEDAGPAFDSVVELASRRL